ncbi:Haloacid dehalogenase-like hydrolase-domain-containing protein [Colletotrichum navitas]|uniref:Haloacid dehalogenase-like hydrolase-domain-containing protein n=1 Tax=Colletotrichum navitas TaxID=681940 RepID=A0AAD8V2D2_9PEZI|nr:Haloacid dehalogenase-like hydrolase-domain-containing protein [Colletotrichum navitas]KAK1579623.1 Haloacid dehalogenase-like hydrolase-domain-containing protein [Colletotrichum navitas]
MAAPRPISRYNCLTFDCFGTLVDWESGMYAALSELTGQLEPSHTLYENRAGTIELFAKHEGRRVREQPAEIYQRILEDVYGDVAQELGLKASAEAKKRFGAGIAEWAAFPDTVAALKRLKQHFKLVILSNVDRTSFSGTLSGPLREVEFDAIYTAQDIGSYKPDSRNFDYLVEHVAEDLGVSKDGIIHTAYSFPHDLVPAKKLGIVGAWIERGEEVPTVMGGKLEDVPDHLRPSWQFKSLRDMADAVDLDAANRK